MICLTILQKMHRVPPNHRCRKKQELSNHWRKSFTYSSQISFTSCTAADDTAKLGEVRRHGMEASKQREHTLRWVNENKRVRHDVTRAYAAHPLAWPLSRAGSTGALRPPLVHCRYGDALSLAETDKTSPALRSIHHSSNPTACMYTCTVALLVRRECTRASP